MTAMHCIRCGRAILRPASAVTIPARTGVGRVSGVAAWGPRCAIVAGLVKPKRRVISSNNSRQVTRVKNAGAGQSDWVDDVLELDRIEEIG